MLLLRVVRAISPLLTMPPSASRNLARRRSSSTLMMHPSFMSMAKWSLITMAATAKARKRKPTSSFQPASMPFVLRMSKGMRDRRWALALRGAIQGLVGGRCRFGLARVRSGNLSSVPMTKSALCLRERLRNRRRLKSCWMTIKPSGHPQMLRWLSQRLDRIRVRRIFCFVGYTQAREKRSSLATRFVPVG